MEIDEALESYINGNITHVRNWLQNATISLGELLEFYIYDYKPSTREIVLFVKRLEQ